MIFFRRYPLIILSVLLCFSIFIALLCGPVQANAAILHDIRLPRVLLGSLVGIALATAGTIFQGLLRNPLADPFTLGTSSGASLGVMIASFLGLHSIFGLYGLAFSFAMGAVFVVYRISTQEGKAPVQTLILAGVVVGTFLNALVFLGISLFYRQSFSALYFLLGTMTESDPRLLRVSSILILSSLAAAWIYARDLNLLSQGENTARLLGLDPEPAKRVLFISASLCVAAAVAVSGMIGFVGLVVPHLLRLLVGPDHRKLLPSSALAGGSLVVLMDALARTVAAPIEIPVGVLAAIGGTPFFLYLLIRKRGDVF